MQIPSLSLHNFWLGQFAAYSFQEPPTFDQLQLFYAFFLWTDMGREIPKEISWKCVQNLWWISVHPNGISSDYLVEYTVLVSRHLNSWNLHCSRNARLELAIFLSAFQFCVQHALDVVVNGLRWFVDVPSEYEIPFSVSHLGSGWLCRMLSCNASNYCKYRCFVTDTAVSDLYPMTLL